MKITEEVLKDIKFRSFKSLAPDYMNPEFDSILFALYKYNKPNEKKIFRLGGKKDGDFRFVTYDDYKLTAERNLSEPISEEDFNLLIKTYRKHRK